MSEPQDQDQAQLYQQIIEKCWTDDDFKQQLLADPMATLKAEGVEIPEGLSVIVLENTNALIHMVIPNTAAQLTDDQLDTLTGGILGNTLAATTEPLIRYLHRELNFDSPKIMKADALGLHNGPRP